MKPIVHVLVGLALGMVLSACAVAGSTSSSPSGSATDPEPGPSPTSSHGADHQHDHQHGLGLEAQVEPSCIAPGEDVTLTVRTDPRAPVAYLAYYSDGGSGADEPIGKGYGGNDGGFADSSGRYEDTWTVAQGAPPGPARVEVKAAAAGEHGDAEARFTLALSSESCPDADR